MPTSRANPHTPRQMAPRCAAIPGLMHARRDLARTRAELARVVALADEAHGLVPRTEKDHHADAMANLWFLRAVHDFGVALAATPSTRSDEDADFFCDTLLFAAKAILQKFISGAVDGVRMDDGGMLTGGVAGRDDVRVNALWYNALEMTAQVLKSPPGGNAAAKDIHASHHFERLAGRFRRSFAKTFWCSDHNCICPPALRELPDHGKRPDPDQLLVTMLPASPLPRTKQRQILSRIHQASLGALGVELVHPEHGIVESPVHRVWLARGYAADGGEGRSRAVTLLAPLAPFHDRARRTAMHACYKAGYAVPSASHKADALTSAEVFGALEQFGIDGT